jgi:hypothetical protein
VDVVNRKNIKSSGIFYYIELCIALFADHFSIKRLEIRSKIMVLGSKYSKISQLYQSEDFEILSILTVTPLFFDQVQKIFLLK